MAKAQKSAAKKSSAKRTLISPKGDKRYIKRDTKGRITESDDQGRSLSQDKKKTAKKKVKSGYGDKGDQQETSASSKKKSSPAKKKSAPAGKKSASKKVATRKNAAKKK